MWVKFDGHSPVQAGTWNMMDRDILALAAQRRGVGKGVMKCAMDAFLRDVLNVVVGGGEMLVVGFGLFLMKDGEFKVIRDCSWPVDNSPRSVYTVANPVVAGVPMRDYCLRTRHIEGEPLYMTLLVDINRYLMFKGGMVEEVCCPWGTLSLVGSVYKPVPEFKGWVKEISEEWSRAQSKVALWVPRLVNILTAY